MSEKLLDKCQTFIFLVPKNHWTIISPSYEKFMFLIGMEVKKEEIDTLFPKQDYLVLREELCFPYMDFSASNTLSALSKCCVQSTQIVWNQ